MNMTSWEERQIFIHGTRLVIIIENGNRKLEKKSNKKKK